MTGFYSRNGTEIWEAPVIVVGDDIGTKLALSNDINRVSRITPQKILRNFHLWANL
jgi:hypothetical protein